MENTQIIETTETIETAKVKKPLIRISHLFYNEAKQIKLDFFYNPELNEEVKKIEGMKWNQEYRCWYFLNNKENLKAVFAALKGKVWFDTREFFPKKDKKEKEEIQLNISEIKSEPDFERMVDEYIEELEAKSYSKSTIKAQKNTIVNFIEFVKNWNTKEVVAVSA